MAITRPLCPVVVLAMSDHWPLLVDSRKNFITHIDTLYTTVQCKNFAGKKLWRIWQFLIDLPKFYPPTFWFTLSSSCTYKYSTYQCLFHQTCLGYQSAVVFYHPSFLQNGIPLHIQASTLTSDKSAS